MKKYLQLFIQQENKNKYQKMNNSTLKLLNQKKKHYQNLVFLLNIVLINQQENIFKVRDQQKFKILVKYKIKMNMNL